MSMSTDLFAPDARRANAVKGNPRGSGYERQAQDWYVEPRRAIDELLDVETFRGLISDPACGGGNIVQACLDRGLPAIGSDIVDRGWRSPKLAGDDPQLRDFLEQRATSAMNIITNPPFNLAVEFALHAMELVEGKVCILQRTTWLEGERRYQALFSKGHLMRVWQFRSRISMPPGDSTSPAVGGSVAFAWFVFSRAHNGPYHGGWLP